MTNPHVLQGPSCPSLAHWHIYVQLFTFLCIREFVCRSRIPKPHSLRITCVVPAALTVNHEFKKDFICRLISASRIETVDMHPHARQQHFVDAITELLQERVCSRTSRTFLHLLDRLCEPPVRAYSPEPEGVGKDKPEGDGSVVVRLRIDRVEALGGKMAIARINSRR